MFDFFNSAFSLLDKLLDLLISLRIKPTIKIINFELIKIPHNEETTQQNMRFSAIISNNTNKTLSVSNKHLYFYKDKELIQDVKASHFEIVHRDGLHILTPIDDIIILNPGESQKLNVVDGSFNYLSSNRIIFSYYTGRKTYNYKINLKDIIVN